MLFESSATVVGKNLTARYPGMVVVTLESLVGFLAVLPLALYESATSGCWIPGSAALAGVVYLALVCSFFGYGVWFTLMRHTDLSSMAGFLFLQPMLGPVIAYAVLHERLGLWTFAGAALVISGVWLVAIVGRPSPPLGSSRKG